MSANKIPDIHSTIVDEAIQGNVALWIAEEWRPPPIDSLKGFLRLPWLGIWSETTDSTLTRMLKTTWSSDEYAHARHLCEVPNRLDESLGSHYSLAQICPVFYLNGREQEWNSLPERERRRARDEKIDEVLRIGSSVLLLVGFKSADAILRVLLDELPETDCNLRFVVAEADSSLLSDLCRRVLTQRPEFFGKLRAVGWSLERIAGKALEVLSAQALPGTNVRVGESIVSIDELLHRERPIDQDFVVITIKDTEAPSAVEETAALVEDFMAGRSLPWAALSLNGLWQRPFSGLNAYDAVLDALRTQRRRGRAPVTCLSIAAEQGSGLSTLLQEIVFRTAQQGYPALLKRNEVDTVDYETLRVYLEYIQTTRAGALPAVVVIDDADSASYSATDLSELPRKLARDGRHVVIVRGVRIRAKEEFDDLFKKDKQIPGAGSKVNQIWFHTPIRERLNEDELQSLCNWATLIWPEATTDVLEQALETWARDWDSEGELPPLLICLYILLRDQLDDPAQFGRHLFMKVKSLTDELRDYEKQSGVQAEMALSGKELRLAVELLKRSFGKGTDATGTGTLTTPLKKWYRPSSETVSQTFLLLSLLGALRLVLPKRVISRLLGVSGSEVQEALRELRDCDLVSEFLDPSDDSSAMHARDAYYTVPTFVGLRHPRFGNLVLDYILRNSNSQELPGVDEWLREIRDCRKTSHDLYPLWALIPIFRRLSPTRDEVEFAEKASQNLLRLQRVQGSHYHQWLFRTNQADNILLVIDQIPETVVRQCASILHTRGITRYKSCSNSRPLDDCRDRYRKASEDFELAYDKALTEHEGEHPANIVTSHGLMYLNWSIQERLRNREDRSEAARKRELARRYLREGIRLRPDNRYAAFGLATMLIDECEEFSAQDRSKRANEFATLLGEVFELLQHQPDATVAEEWENLYTRAITLLKHKAVPAIDRLKRDGYDLWRALRALQILEGDVPLEVTSEGVESERLREAWRILGQSALEAERESALGNLLRYAVFSSMPDRIEDPAFLDRFTLLSRLEGSRSLEDPLFLYDYAMLACQTGDYNLGEQLFRRLRQGRRFLEVPLERSVPLFVVGSNARERLVARLRIVKTDEKGRGWGRIQKPESLRMTIPFSTKDFKSSGLPVHPGSVVEVYLLVRSAGLYAEPYTASSVRNSRGT